MFTRKLRYFRGDFGKLAWTFFFLVGQFTKYRDIFFHFGPKSSVSSKTVHFFWKMSENCKKCPIISKSVHSLGGGFTIKIAQFATKPLFLDTWTVFYHFFFQLQYIFCPTFFCHFFFLRTFLLLFLECVYAPGKSFSSNYFFFLLNSVQILYILVKYV